MLKNEITNRLIINVVLAGILVGMLPTSALLHGQQQTEVSRTDLRARIVEPEVAKIKRVVTGLNVARIAVPSIIAAITVLVMIAATVVGGILIWHIKKRIRLEKSNTKNKYRKYAFSKSWF